MSKIQENMSINGGGDGAYNTPKAARKTTSKDKNSPTGFESSPNPNMYTKTMKFKIVDPKDRINSKDLWSPKKGQPKFDSFPNTKRVYEIKVNPPSLFKFFKKYDDDGTIEYHLDNEPFYLDDNILVYVGDNLNKTKSILKKYNIKYEIDYQPDKTVIVSSNYIKNINEIKVNKPLNDIFNILPSGRKEFNYYKIVDILKKLFPEDYINDIEMYADDLGVSISDEGGMDERFNFEEYEKDRQKVLDDYERLNLRQDFLKYINNSESHAQSIMFSKNYYNLNEVRYSKFKKNTAKRTPQEQLHMAVKEIQMQMDNVNKLVEFTSKMKQELKESEENLKYLNRTKNSLAKIQEKIQHISNKIKTIIE